MDPTRCLADAYDPQLPTPKPIYPVFRWPEDIVSVPCSARKKDEFGSWVLDGTLDWTGGDIRAPKPAYQPASPEGAIVEKKCAGK
jgi:hypothetical protein